MWTKNYRVLILLWLWTVYGVIDVTGKNVKRNVLIDNIHSGIKYAGKILGIDTASDVAELVSRAFATTINKKTSFQQTNQPNSENRNDLHEKQSATEQPTFMTGIFRLMGMDSSKLGALALNGLIFIAQMIGNMLMKPQKSSEDTNQPQVGNADRTKSKIDKRNLSLNSPMDWILNSPNEQLNHLMQQVRDKNLPQNLINMVDNLESKQGDGECIKLMLCKSAPFVWGMQRAIHDRIDGTAEEPQQDETTDENIKNHSNQQRMLLMFKYIPDLNEFKIHGDACEHRYKSCKLYD